MGTSLRSKVVAGRSRCCSGVFCLILVVLVSYKAVFTQTNTESSLSEQEEGAYVVRFCQKQGLETTSAFIWSVGESSSCLLLVGNSAVKKQPMVGFCCFFFCLLPLVLIAMNITFVFT